MATNSRGAIIVASTACIVGAVATSFAQRPVKSAAPATPKFATVNKILKDKCSGCHSGSTPGGGVDLSSYEKVMASKFKGKPVVVPKKTKDSVLSKAIHGTGVMKMPPPGVKLSADEIKLIDAWIAGGAKK